MSEFTDRMERKADEIAALMEAEFPSWERAPGGRSNIKPWYSARSMFKPGVERALVGIDPGGEPSAPDDTTGKQYQDALNGDTFNAFLDESWPGYGAGGAPLQLAIREVYKNLYPDTDPTGLIRSTACFNACPVRTGLGSKLDPRSQVWKLSQKWMLDVIEHIEPTVVICIGNGNTSPWQALRVSAQPPFKFARSAHLKYGTARLSDGSVVRVIGLPHLTGGQFSRPNLYAAIRDNRESLLGLTS